MLFADRLEIWNLGELPPTLMPERLREPHPSIPRNPLIAEPLYLTRYIEKAGTGTLDMISLCRQAGLPEPDFRQNGGQFVMTLWRDWLTPRTLDMLEINPRQRQAVLALRHRKILTNARYQEIVGASRKMAARDLTDLVKKGILKRQGSGRGVRYVLDRKTG